MPSSDTQFQVGNPGRFQVGNSGRPKGSKNKATLHREALAEVLTLEREHELWRSLIALAIDGDVAAARVVLEYRYGKPRQVHEIEGDFGLQALTFNVVPVGQEPP